MSEMRELIDTELDAVCGGHHGHHGCAELPHLALGQDFRPHGHHGQGHFGFGNIGDINFGNIVIQENIVEQVGVAIGGDASVTNLLGGQLNASSIASSIAGNIGDFNLGNLGNIVNFGNIVIQENIAEQVGVAIGSNASVTNLIGGQLNSSSIA